MNLYGFYTGKEFEIFKNLGAHCSQNGTHFCTYAPAASRISVIGEFNGWKETPMNKSYDGNFWECFVDNAFSGQMYKYRIYSKSGEFIDHCDPFGYYSEVRPNSASKIFDLNNYKFNDEKWIHNRNNLKNKPLNIYEMHFGSWLKKDEQEETGWFKYEEIGEKLINYLKENGYNFLELMPLTEYPCDASWGYQPTGFFCATSRYGDPNGLKKFIDTCHQNNIGVIMDFVPVHFAVDGFALRNYDGTALYEYPNNDVGVSEWGSCNFMHSRGEVRSFLQSSAYFWLSEFHFDGLRMDAVSNLIYWQGDASRGVNSMTIDFIKTMNSGLKQRIPNILLVAEDSSSYEGVTRPVEQGGLGFDYKWDLGWMNDTLDYFRLSPEQRINNYHKLTFSMLYYYKENYILPFSHDEVVHSKASIIQKMNGDYDKKFPQARALYLYMMCHPGKKLNFMGNELAQFREWDETRSQDWDLLKYPKHDAFHRYIIKLNKIYMENPALYEDDYSPDGFYWTDCASESLSAYSFIRKSSEQTLLALFNFSDKDIEYSIDKQKIPYENFTFLIDSEQPCYGGEYGEKSYNVKCEDEKFIFHLSPFSAQLYQLNK